MDLETLKTLSETEAWLFVKSLPLEIPIEESDLTLIVFGRTC